MRIIAEWYASPAPNSTCMCYHVEAFEGDTVEEINAAIRAKAGPGVEYEIIGLRNTRENFEIYTGRPTKPEYRFADDFPPETAGRIARLFRRFLAWAGL